VRETHTARERERERERETERGGVGGERRERERPRMERKTRTREERERRRRQTERESARTAQGAQMPFLPKIPQVMQRKVCCSTKVAPETRSEHLGRRRAHARGGVRDVTQSQSKVGEGASFAGRRERERERREREERERDYMSWAGSTRL